MLKFSDSVRRAILAGAMGAGLLGVSALAFAPIASAQQMHDNTGFRGGFRTNTPVHGGPGFRRDWDDRGFRGDWDDRWGWRGGPGWGVGVGFYGYPYYGYSGYPYGCDYYDYYYGYCPDY